MILPKPYRQSRKYHEECQSAVKNGFAQKHYLRFGGTSTNAARATQLIHLAPKKSNYIRSGFTHHEQPRDRRIDDYRSKRNRFEDLARG